MNNNEELLRKWQLKKIATLAFINDECDDMKPKDRKSFYSMMEAILGEIVGDLKNLPLADVIRCPKCGSENEYSQGFKKNIQPVDGGDWRQVCFNICDRCGYAIDVWFWD